MVPFFAKNVLTIKYRWRRSAYWEKLCYCKKRPSTNLPNKSFLILYNLITKKALHATNGVIDKKKK